MLRPYCKVQCTFESALHLTLRRMPRLRGPGELIQKINKEDQFEPLTGAKDKDRPGRPPEAGCGALQGRAAGGWDG
jgi:hypothetical protein